MCELSASLQRPEDCTEAVLPEESLLAAGYEGRESRSHSLSDALRPTCSASPGRRRREEYTRVEFHVFLWVYVLKCLRLGRFRNPNF